MELISFENLDCETIAQFTMVDDYYFGGITRTSYPASHQYWEAFMQAQYTETVPGMLRAVSVLARIKGDNFTITSSKGRCVIRKEMKADELATVLRMDTEDVRSYFSNHIVVA